MDAQDVMLGARVAHVRELKAALAQAKAENAALRDENAALRAHFDFALLAAEDLRGMPPDGRLEIWDGWNLILGSPKEAKDRPALIAQAKARLAQDATGALRVWIVFDGPEERVAQEGRLRVSYTGGTGAHRADRLVVSFVRMAAYLGLAGRLAVRTNDRDFARDAKRLLLSGRDGLCPVRARDGFADPHKAAASERPPCRCTTVGAHLRCARDGLSITPQSPNDERK